MFQIVVAVALMVVSYMLAPKPKLKNAEVQEGKVPTASADSPIRVIFGEVNIEESNVVWFGDQQVEPIIAESGGK